MQLGGGSRLAEVTKVPESSDEEDGSPKRRRHEDPVSPKKRASDSGGSFDWGMLRQMLQEQKADIIAASQEQTSGLLRGLDEKYEQRFLKVEQGCEGLLGKVSTMDSRLTRVEELLPFAQGLVLPLLATGALWMRGGNSLWSSEGGIRTPSVE